MYNVADKFGFPASHGLNFVDLTQIAIQKQQAQRELAVGHHENSLSAEIYFTLKCVANSKKETVKFC